MSFMQVKSEEFDGFTYQVPFIIVENCVCIVVIQGHDDDVDKISNKGQSG